MDDHPRPHLVDLPAGQRPLGGRIPAGRSRRSTTATCRRRCSRRPTSSTSALPSPEEINELTPEQVGSSTTSTPTSSNEWQLLPEGDAARGEAQTTVDAALAEGIVRGLEDHHRLRLPLRLRDRRQARAAERRRLGPGDQQDHQHPAHHQPAPLRHRPAPADHRPGGAVPGEPPPPEADPRRRGHLGRAGARPRPAPLPPGPDHARVRADVRAAVRHAAPAGPPGDEHRSAPLPATTGG